MVVASRVLIMTSTMERTITKIEEAMIASMRVMPASERPLTTDFPRDTTRSGRSGVPTKSRRPRS